MNTPEFPKPPAVATQPRRRRRILRGCAAGCAGVLLLFVALLVALVLVLGRVPKSYPLSSNPIPAPTPTNTSNLGVGLDGFSSPYLGHTGSWNGKGGTFGGNSKIPDLDKERAMGLCWTFMPVYWCVLEPDGPVDLNQGVPSAWAELDAFIVSAQKRQLNVLMQAPVVGGNGGGPPDWAGRREPGKSAPANMAALAAFAGKLADRYRPGGTLAQREGWGQSYGVRAWELDNEPESYRTHWKGQAGDYAEFVTRAAAAIKAADPQSVIVAPGIASGRNGIPWLAETLNPQSASGSPTFLSNGVGYSIGPVIDVVSFHNYEGLDSFFAGGPRTIAQVLDDVSAVLNSREQTPGFTYARKQDYWHTEGNFDFVGILSSERRAAWRFQFFTRAFAAGIRKVAVMDASPAEQKAVRAYINALPDPFPMLPALKDVAVVQGQVAAFRHPDGAAADAGQVWVLWALANTGPAIVDLPARRDRLEVISVDGEVRPLTSINARARIELKDDARMSPPVIVIDRPQ